MAAGVVEGKEEAAKEVREDGRNATHHQELDTGREFEGGELPIAPIREAAMMEVTVVLISTLVRARVCSRLLCTWSLWLLVVRAGCTIHMLETRWVSLSWNSVTLGGMKTRRKAQCTMCCLYSMFSFQPNKVRLT